VLLHAYLWAIVRFIAKLSGTNGNESREISPPASLEARRHGEEPKEVHGQPIPWEVAVLSAHTYIVENAEFRTPLFLNRTMVKI
jgi:hypothetical protein